MSRVKIIVRALEGQSNSAISEELNLDRGAVRRWRERWHTATERREALQAAGADRQELEKFIVAGLKDSYRSGTPPQFSAEQVV